MPMIDVYAKEGTFRDRKALAKDLAAAVMRWEKVPDISLFRNNTAAFVHDLPADALSNVAGEPNSRRSPQKSPPQRHVCTRRDQRGSFTLTVVPLPSPSLSRSSDPACASATMRAT